MAEVIKLTEKQRERLKEHETLLKKVCFNSQKSTFIDYATTKELAGIYKEITGIEADCKGCADKSFIRRLSFWYCGNRDGVLPTDKTHESKTTKKSKNKPTSGKKGSNN